MAMGVWAIFESINPVTNTILCYEEIKENTFYLDMLCYFRKQIISLFVAILKWIHSQSTYPILRTTYQNNFMFSWVNYLPD